MELTSRRLSLDAGPIEGHGVRLRRYRDEDEPALAVACEDPLTQRYLPTLASPRSGADAAWWVAAGAAAAFATGGGNFAIADPVSDRLVGGIGMAHQQDGQGRIEYWVAPGSRRRGIATAAARSLTDYALSIGYGRIQMCTDFEHTTSQRVAIAAGYVREGVARAAAPGRGAGRRDIIVWSRLISDPPGPAPRYLPDLIDGELTDGVVRLRPMEAADAVEVHPIRSSPDVVANTVTQLAPTPAETARYCAGAAAAWLDGSSLRLTVRDASTGAFAGKIGLQVEDPGTGQAGIDYYVAPEWRGRGYATRAVNLLCRWAFTHTALDRLVAGVFTANCASQQVLERSGFLREGHERSRLPDGRGGRVDLYTYALLRSDVAVAG